MNKEEIEIFSNLFFKFCRYAKCDEYACLDCPVNEAYDMIFNHVLIGQ